MANTIAQPGINNTPTADTLNQTNEKQQQDVLTNPTGGQTDPIKKISPTEFAQKIKTKYPQYKDVDDMELARRTVNKYPQYRNRVDFNISPPKEVQAGEVTGESVAPSADTEDYLSGFKPMAEVQEMTFEIPNAEFFDKINKSIGKFKTIRDQSGNISAYDPNKQTPEFDPRTGNVTINNNPYGQVSANILDEVKKEAGVSDKILSIIDKGEGHIAYLKDVADQLHAISDDFSGKTSDEVLTELNINFKENATRLRQEVNAAVRIFPEFEHLGKHFNVIRDELGDITPEESKFRETFKDLDQYGINIDDFSNYIESTNRRIKNLLRDEILPTVAPEGSKQEVALQMQQYKALQNYAVDRMKYLNDHREILRYRAESGEDVTDRMTRLSEESTNFITGVADYIQKELPGVVNFIKNQQKKVANRYKEHKKKQTVGKVISGSEEFLTQALIGASSGIEDIIIFLADGLGADDYAEEARLGKEISQITESRPLLEMWATGKVVKQNGVQYLVSNDDQIYDLDEKKNITSIAGQLGINVKKIKEAATKTDKEATFFSPYNTSVQLGGVLGNLSVQILGTKGIGSVIGTSSKAMVASSMAMTGGMVYTNIYEQTLQQLRDQGLSEENSREYAGEVAMATGSIAALTSILSPNLQAQKLISKPKIKDLVSKALKAETEGGKKAMFNSIKNNTVKALTSGAKEGVEETVQENLEYITERLASSNVNDHVGREVLEDQINMKDIINNAILSFGASASLAGLGSLKESGYSQDRLELYNLLSTDYNKTQQAVNNMVENELITEQKAQDFMNGIEKFVKYANKLPENMNREKAFDMIDLLDKRGKLEETKSKVDKAFHRGINEEIAQVDKQVNDLLKRKIKTDKETLPEDVQEDTTLSDTQTDVEITPPVLQQEEPITINYTTPDGTQATLDINNLEPTIQKDEKTILFTEKKGNITLQALGNVILEEEGDAIKISSLGIFDQGLEQKGLEEIMYDRAGKIITEQLGKDFISDRQRTPQNNTLWKKLVAEGKAEVVGDPNAADTSDFYYRYIPPKGQQPDPVPTPQQPNIKEKTAEIASRIRGLKANKTAKDALSRLSTTPLFDVVWDGALEAAALAVETTGSIAQAVVDGMNVMKKSKWYQDLSEDGRVKAERFFTETVKREFETDPEDLEKPPIRDVIRNASEVFADKFIQKIIDKYHLVKKTVGKTSKFSVAEKLSHGKIANELEKFDKKEIEPLIKKIQKLGFTNKQVSDYLYAKHATERNEYVKEYIDSENEFGSGMENRKIKEILERYDEQETKKLEQISDDVQKIIKGTRDRMLSYGLITREEYNTFEDFYENYVPLQGFENPEIEFFSAVVPPGLSVKGKETKRVKGRSTKAGEILPNVVKARTDIEIRGSKNKVLETLYDYSQTEQAKGVVTSYTDETLPKKTFFDTTNLSSKYVGVKIDGIQHYLKFENSELNRILNNAGIEKSFLITKAFKRINTHLSAVFTKLNPAFVMLNFFRDIQEAYINIASEFDLDPELRTKKIANKVVKDTFKAIGAIYNNERRSKTSTKFQQYYEDFKNDGAKTGWITQNHIKDIKKKLDNLQKMREAKKFSVKGVQKGIQNTFDFIEDINTAVENGVRLSTYINAREVGVDRERAASIAKDLTVNFNQSGEWGSLASSFFLFFNPAVQGSARFAKAMLTFKRTPSGKLTLNRGQKIAASITAFSSLLTLFNQAISGEDDDGKTFYEKIPDYEKERNLIIMNPLNNKDYFKVPLPYGYNIFSNIGTIAAEVASKDRTVGDGIGFLTSSAIGSFVPISFSESKEADIKIMKTVTPTALKPLFEIAVNEDFFGQQIYDEDLTFATPIPDAEKGRPSTPAIFKNISSFVNKTTGGSEFEPGYVDFAPESLYHVFKFGTGGVGKFATKVAKTSAAGIKLAKGEPTDLEPRQIPFLSKVYGTTSDYNDQREYFDRFTLLRQREKTLMAIEKKNKKQQKELDNVSNVKREFMRINKDLRRNRKDRKSLRKEFADKDRAVKIKEKEEKYFKLIKKANRFYNEKLGKNYN